MAEGHRQRQRRRFLAEGLTNFEPYQALELLLFYAIPRRDTAPIARALLERFGSFSAVLNAPVSELCKVEGMGEGAAAFLHLLPAAANYYMVDQNGYRKQILSTQDAVNHLLPRFVGVNQEQLYLLCLDNGARILFEGPLSQGTVDRSALPLRSITETALRVQASVILLAHNHPRGFAIPSQSDIQSTHTIQRLLFPLGIRLADHIVISDNDCVSMASSGQLLTTEQLQE